VSISTIDILEKECAKRVLDEKSLIGSVPSGLAVSLVSRPESPIKLSEVRIQVGAPIRLTLLRSSYLRL
jgi:hypothetical protein